MENVIQLPFQKAGFNQTFKAVLLSDSASMLTIVADNPFGGTPAYYGGIARVAFIAGILSEKFTLEGKSLTQVGVASLRKLIDEKAPRSVVWETFIQLINDGAMLSSAIAA